MLSLRSLLASFLLVAVALAACEKEAIDTPRVDPVSTPANPDQLNLVVAEFGGTSQGGDACYGFDFPIQVRLSDGSLLDVGDAQACDAILADTSVYVIDLVYPITLVDPAAAQTVVAATEAELVSLLLLCDFGVDDDEDYASFFCYRYDFPVYLVLESGTVATAADEAAFEALVEQDDDEVADFAYPVNFIHAATGNAVTANDEHELAELIDACDEWVPTDDAPLFLVFNSLPDVDPDYVTCYAFVYPVGVAFDDGRSHTVRADAEWEDVILSPSDLEGDFVYPFAVIELASGDTIAVEHAATALRLAYECE